jgi:hypothetical protein
MNRAELPPDIDLNRVRAVFDTAWYLEQNSDVAQAGCDPLQHYLEYGAWEMRNPNPLFDSDWYLAVNPEVAQTGINPLIHYLTVGAAENRDPHPLFDTRTYREVGGALPAQMTPLEVLLSGSRPSCTGVYRSIEDLSFIQKHFLDRVTVQKIFDQRTTTLPWAVFLQCGQSSLHPQWLTPHPKPWHLIVNCYDHAYLQMTQADISLSQNQGTKFSAMYRILEDDPRFFEPYEYVLFLDDDILVTEEAITRLFTIAQSHNLKLAQPSVAPESAHTWSVLITQPDSFLRILNTVEIMMPLLSRDALRLGSHLFSHSISGWGLDFALGDLVNRTFGSGCIAVIDAISGLHARAIDVVHGDYYRMLRENQISPLVEERVMGLLYGAAGPIQEV